MYGFKLNADLSFVLHGVKLVQVINDDDPDIHNYFSELYKKLKFSVAEEGVRLSLANYGSQVSVASLVDESYKVEQDQPRSPQSRLDLMEMLWIKGGKGRENRAMHYLTTGESGVGPHREKMSTTATSRAELSQLKKTLSSA